MALINGFVPAAGQSFDVLDFDAARDTGTFSTITLPTLPAGLTWNTTELYRRFVTQDKRSPLTINALNRF